MEYYPLYIVGTLLFTAFFSGIEIAYLTSNKLRIELGNKKGNISDRIVSFFVKHPSKFYTTTLIGLNIFIVLFSIYFSDFIDLGLQTNFNINEQNSPTLVIIVQTVLGSLVLLFLGEFLPKAFFRAVPNTLLHVFAIPFLLVYYILFPLSLIVEWLSNLLLKLFFKSHTNDETPQFTKRDLFHYVNETDAKVEDTQVEVDKQIFKNAIQFSELKVRECMIPRTDIVAIEVTDDIEHATELLIKSGHSKLLVYREKIDNVIGYIHLVDLYNHPSTIDKIVMPITIATESMPAGDLMNALIARRRSIAVVVNEFGSTSGLVSVEDIIEQITGEIEDEHDSEDLTEVQISNTEWMLSARLEVNYLNDKYNLNLPEGDYETLGGLILAYNRNVPIQNDVIDIDPYKLTVLNIDGTRILEVNLCITKSN
ncbi:MAG: hemolysin family protein [Bacteroidota bacterium]|nr:hemolysin family protein [Bacteroidota bacterium]